MKANCRVNNLDSGHRGLSRFIAAVLFAFCLVPNPTAWAQQAAITWKLHGDQAATFWWSEELARFAKAMEGRTNGRMKLEFYPAASLGVAPQAILAPVRAGSIEMAEFVASYVTSEAPALTVLGLPMIATSVEHGLRIMNVVRGDLEADLAQKHDLVLLATLSSSPLQLFLAKNEFRNMDSFKGLRIRTLGPDQELFIRALGATPVNVPIAEMVSSVATNRVDGVIAGTQYFVTQKLSQYGPNLLAWNAILGPGYLVVGKTKWQSLPADLQQAVMGAAREFEQQVWKRAASLEAEMQTQATAQGFKIIRLSDSDRSALVGKARDAWTGWAQRGGSLSKRLMDAAMSTK